MSWITFNKFITGNSRRWDLRIKTLYSKVFRKHRKEDWTVNDPLKDHPEPWKWFRVMLFITVIGIISFINSLFIGVNAFPWLALIAAASVPLTCAVFISETILSEKISFLSALVVFIIGATTSFLITWLLSIPINFGDDGLNAVISAPITEEVAKVFVIVLTLRIMKIKSVSAAIFLGWVVGSGFQVAETLGYSSYFGYLGLFSQIQFLPGGTEYIFVGALDYSTILIRLLFSFGMHAFWGAIHGAAIIFARRGSRKKINLGRFSIWFFFCIIMHMLWNTLGIYIANQALAMALMIFVQIIYIPLFFYLIDAGLRDHHDLSQIIPENDTPTNDGLAVDLAEVRAE